MSDHISGPRALADPIADITDVYAFPSPESPGRLVLVLNTLPMAKPSDLFSAGLLYRFRLRPLSPAEPASSGWAFVPGDEEVVLDCVFDAPEHVSDPARASRTTSSTGRCVTPERGTGLASASTTRRAARGAASGSSPASGGTRSSWTPAPPWRRSRPAKLAFTDPGSIFLDGKNVLSIVVEIDTGFLPGWTLVGVVAETLTRGEFNVRIERVGRPEVKNMMLAPKDFDPVNRDLEIRDLYNMDDAFHLGDSYAGAFRARLDANLAFWDGLDGKHGLAHSARTAATRSPTWSSPTTWSSTSPSPTSSRARSSRSSSPPDAARRTRRAGAGP